jgi:hypothetical protein
MTAAEVDYILKDDAAAHPVAADGPKAVSAGRQTAQQAKRRSGKPQRRRAAERFIMVSEATIASQLLEPIDRVLLHLMRLSNYGASTVHYTNDLALKGAAVTRKEKTRCLMRLAARGLISISMPSKKVTSTVTILPEAITCQLK